MGFKQLFKVRKPGNGNAVQKAFEAAARAKVSVKDVTNVLNGGKKEVVNK